MTRITTIVASLALAAGLAACKKEEKKTEAPVAAVAPAAAAPAAEAKTADIGKVEAAELETWIAAKTVAVFDVNGDGVRKEHGKIPTATLLTSSEDYDVAELPAEKDKKLVFYCSNTQCGASKKGASKALAAGYTDVNVLPVGVIGWKEAGHETEAAM